MQNLFKKIQCGLQWLARRLEAVSPHFIKRILWRLEPALGMEYSCEDTYRLLDEFAEAVLHGRDVTRLMPLVARHMAGCPDCREEFEALMRILRASSTSHSPGMGN